MRLIELGYAVTAYLGFVVVAAWLVAFLNDFLVPVGAGAGPPPADLLAAIATDLALILVVAVQHGVMARAWFQRAWRRRLAAELLRPTFVWTANLSFVALFALWQPIPATVWRTGSPFVAGMLHGIAAAGWLLAIGATFALGHARFFGLEQVWRRWRGRPERGFRLQVGFCYRVVRHPLMLGLWIGCFATPHMTLGRLVFALTITAFLAIAIPLEERRLARELGPAWFAYRDEVPMLLPWRFGGGRPRRPGQLEVGAVSPASGSSARNRNARA